jgi:hypothetical protein
MSANGAAYLQNITDHSFITFLSIRVMSFASEAGTSTVRVCYFCFLLLQISIVKALYKHLLFSSTDICSWDATVTREGNAARNLLICAAIDLTFMLRVLRNVLPRKPRLTAVGIRCADHATPSTGKSWHYLRRQAAVGIVPLRTKSHGV